MKFKMPVLFRCLLLLALCPFSLVLAAPQAPQLIGPQGVQVEVANFEWFELTDATWYRISAWDNSGSVLRKWVRSDATCNILLEGICSYQSSIQANGVVTWQIKAFDGTDQGPWSIISKFWGGVNPPLPPVLLAPVGVASIGEYSWSNIDDATWYRLEIADDTLSPLFGRWIKVGRDTKCDQVSGACTFLVDTFLPVLWEGFSWRVRTYNGAKVGAWSEWAAVQISFDD